MRDFGQDERFVRIEQYRVTIDKSRNELHPFEKDIIIDYDPVYPNPIVVTSPLMPTKFYRESEIKRIKENTPKIYDEIIRVTKAESDKYVPKAFGFVNDRRLARFRPKYEYRQMHNGNKIYKPTLKATINNFKELMELFKSATFTVSFLEAFQDALKDKIELQKAKEEFNKYKDKPNLISEKDKGWKEDFRPFQHQKIMHKAQVTMNHFANLSEMGTGKTYPTIISIVTRIKKEEIDKAFIICPVTISKSVWMRQIRQYSNLEAIVVEGTPKQRKLALSVKADVYIIGYEMYNVLKNDIEPFIDQRTMVILDESSKIKNPKAKRSKAIHRLGRLTKYKIILNGTPITQGAMDIFSQFLFLDNGKTFGNNYDQFMRTYFYKNAWSYRWEVKNDEALDEISDKIYSVGIRFLKEDCLDLPPKLYEQREVKMTKEQWDAYEEMREEMITWIETKERRKEKIEAQIVVVKLLRLAQITSGFSKNEEADIVRFAKSPKLIELENMLDSLLYNGNQVVIWARFIPDIMAIDNLLKKKNISHKLLYGKISQHDREKAVSDFQKGSVKVFVGQQGSGGLGIDLFNANHVIYYSNDFTLLNRLQSEDRTHRSGSEIHNKVTYYDLVAIGPGGEQTIDYHILNVVLRQKKEIADIITKDNLREFVDGILGVRNGK